MVWPAARQGDVNASTVAASPQEPAVAPVSAPKALTVPTESASPHRPVVNKQTARHSASSVSLQAAKTLIPALMVHALRGSPVRTTTTLQSACQRESVSVPVMSNARRESTAISSAVPVLKAAAMTMTASVSAPAQPCARATTFDSASIARVAL